jgi:hypothetical protein
MKIIISDANTRYIYREIEDPTSSQVIAHMGSQVIVINNEEYVIDCSVMDNDNNVLNIMVIGVQSTEEDIQNTENIEE